MDIEISKAGERLIKRINRQPKNILDKLILKFKDSDGECLLKALSDNNISGSKMEISIQDKLYFLFSVEGYYYLFGIGRKTVSINVCKNIEDGKVDIKEDIELNLDYYNDEYELLVDIVKKFFYYNKKIHSPEFVIMKNKEKSKSLEKQLRLYIKREFLGQLLWISCDIAFLLIFIFTGYVYQSRGALVFTILFCTTIAIAGISQIKEVVFYLKAYKKYKIDLKANNLIKLNGKPNQCRLVAYSKSGHGFKYGRIELTFDNVRVYYFPPKPFGLAHKWKSEIKRHILNSPFKLEYYSNSKIIENTHSNINKIVSDKIGDLINSIH